MKHLLTTAGLSVALLVLGGAGAASAAPAATAAGGNTCVSTTNGAAIGCFYPYGDHVLAYDNAPDGHHVEVYWSVDRYSGVCKNFDGYDQANHQPTVKDCNYDFAEHSKVCLRAAVVEGDTVVGSYSSRRCYDTTTGQDL